MINISLYTHKLLLFIAFFALVGEQSTRSSLGFNNYNDVLNRERNCDIDLEAGIIDNVVLGETRLKSIKNRYGNNEIQKSRTFFSSLLGFLILEAKLVYKELGVEFIFDSTIGKRNLFGNHKINLIKLTEGCNCKTKDHIGIDSGYMDLENVYGEILNFRGVSSVSGSYSEIWFDLYNNKDQVIAVSFRSDLVKDKTDFVIKEIVIYTK